MAHQMEDYLWQIHKEMKSRGLPDMDDDTLRELSKHLQHPQVMQGFQSGQLTAAKIADEVQAALRTMSEGGLVNDRAGTGTRQVRNQLGIPTVQPQSAALPPGGGSRLFREPNLALGDSLISNLPADPRDQQRISPVLRETEEQRRRRLNPLRTL